MDKNEIGSQNPKLKKKLGAFASDLCCGIIMSDTLLKIDFHGDWGKQRGVEKVVILFHNSYSKIGFLDHVYSSKITILEYEFYILE